MHGRKKIFVIAGEESGDIIGGDLLRQIRNACPDCDIQGVGGDRMERAGGFQSLFPLSDLSVMGLAEVIAHLPRLLHRIGQAKRAMTAFQPDLLLTIDAPDFTLRIARWTRHHLPRTKTLHTVAPSVWAWRAGRAKKIARYLDGLLCLLPFEPPYFTAYGLAARFIGHPLTQIIPARDEAAVEKFCKQYSLNRTQPILCVLPGSRRREIEALLPIFLDTVTQLHAADPTLQIILPTLPHLVDTIRDKLPAYTTLPIILLPDRADKYLAMQASDVALHASGTVALELALCDTPMVTAYKMSALSIWIARRLLKINDVNLVNLLAGHRIVPEYIQERCTPHDLAPAVSMLLRDPLVRQRQTTALQDVQKKLRADLPAIDFIKEFL